MAGIIPESFITQLISRVDIVDVIKAKIPLKKAGANYTGLCPFHNEKTPSFSVSHNKQFYHCFGCGVSGDVIQFVIENEGLSFVDAIEYLAKSVGLKVIYEDKGQNKNEIKEPEIYSVLSLAKDYYKKILKDHTISKQAVEYLKSREITGNTARDFELGYAPNSWNNLSNNFKGSISDNLLERAGLIKVNDTKNSYDRFRHRIIFPIKDTRGRIIGFGGRVINNEEPKYLNSPETEVFSKGKELYGLFEAKKHIKQLKQIIVVEGYMDVISLYQHGIKNVVATLGTALTVEHLTILFKSCSEIVFCFDSDNAGQRAAWRSLNIGLSNFKENKVIKFLVLDKGHDPDSFIKEFGKDKFLDEVKRSRFLSDYLFEELSKEVDLDHIDGRTKFVMLCRPLIRLLPEGIYKEMMFNRLAELVGLDVLSVKEEKLRYSPKKFNKQEKNISTMPVNIVKRALAMILERRDLLNFIGDITVLKSVKVPGVELFCKVIDVIFAEPMISLPDIKTKLDVLDAKKLNEYELRSIIGSIPNGGIEAEFKGAISKLSAYATEYALDLLLVKARDNQLTKLEKEQLQQLLVFKKDFNDSIKKSEN